MMALTVGSLFSGIGGIDLGLTRAGMEIKWQCEKDPWCRKILTKHWPEVPKYEDVTTLQPEAVAYVDVLAGGFPCQDLSVAGKRAGLREGTRSGLWLEFARIIRGIRPKYVLVENVPGLLVNHALGRVLGDLADCGYDAEWQVLSAAQFGAPHLRKRVWVVAYANDSGNRAPIGGINRNGEKKDTKQQEPFIESGGQGENVADTESQRCREAREYCQRSAQRIACGCEVYHAKRQHDDASGYGASQIFWQQSRQAELSKCWKWLPEPAVGRVAHGLPNFMDRLRGLGNAVVPQIVEFIGKQIMTAHFNREDEHGRTA